ncbi:MAG TPA: hypothetical protein VJS69_09415 [Candidatus Krumholzibacteria bacterium]|nr:hypothetical protein [Candidatus Krumholzibacteria bacterium]
MIDDAMLTESLKKLAAPLPPGAREFRIDGKPISKREGEWIVRVVAYVSAQFCRARLDEVIPGRWSLRHEPMPMSGDEDGVAEVVTKAIITIHWSDALQIVREGIGSGRDAKSAATDSFKRGAERLGIGSENYDLPVLWVKCSADGKKLLEDPEVVLTRLLGKKAELKAANEAVGTTPSVPARAPAPTPSVREQVAAAFPDPYTDPTPVRASSKPSFSSLPICPKCGGELKDLRPARVANPRLPLFRCERPGCTGVIWPTDTPKPRAKAAASSAPTPPFTESNTFPDALRDEQDDLPF